MAAANKWLLKPWDNIKSNRANWKESPRRNTKNVNYPQKRVTCKRFSGRFCQKEPHLHGNVHRHFLSNGDLKSGQHRSFFPLAWSTVFKALGQWPWKERRCITEGQLYRKELSRTPGGKYWYHRKKGETLSCLQLTAHNKLFSCRIKQNMDKLVSSLFTSLGLRKGMRKEREKNRYCLLLAKSRESKEFG